MKEGLTAEKKDSKWVVEKWIAGYPYGCEILWNKSVNNLEEVVEIGQQENLSILFKS